MTVSLIGRPVGFESLLGELPVGAKLRTGARGHADLVIWFVSTRPQLAFEIRRITRFAAGVPLWIAWRKATRRPRGAADGSAPSENDVREAGLASGLVDYKVCAIDAEWSGLLFAVRKGDAG
jgi:hypothetical protein